MDSWTEKKRWSHASRPRERRVRLTPIADDKPGRRAGACARALADGLAAAATMREGQHEPRGAEQSGVGGGLGNRHDGEIVEAHGGTGRGGGYDVETDAGHRSEEHTSDLQSRENLVCRLLLE